MTGPRPLRIAARDSVAVVCGLLLAFCAARTGGSARADGWVACPLPRMALTLGPLISEPTGQHTLALRLTNREGFACVLFGYPRVKLYDRSGVIPFSIRHGGDQVVTSHRPAPVDVRPGRSAFVVLNHYRCDLGTLRAAGIVTVGLAGTTHTGTAWIRIKDPSRKPGYCGPGDPGSTLAVSPFEPTLEAAFTG